MNDSYTQIAIWAAIIVTILAIFCALEVLWKSLTNQYLLEKQGYVR